MICSGTFILFCSKFSYSDIQVSDKIDSLARAQHSSNPLVTVTAMVTNPKDRAVSEVVQYHSRDLSARLEHPFRSLKGFRGSI
jgi:hypothetical protein